MRAMVLEEIGRPLAPRELTDPEPGAGELLIAVHACAVCRTDLHIVDGDLPQPELPSGRATRRRRRTSRWGRRSSSPR